MCQARIIHACAFSMHVIYKPLEYFVGNHHRKNNIIKSRLICACMNQHDCVYRYTDATCTCGNVCMGATIQLHACMSTTEAISISRCGIFHIVVGAWQIIQCRLLIIISMS